MRPRLLLALALVTPLGFATKLAPGLDAPWIRFYAGGVLYEIFWVLVVLFVAPRLAPLAVAGGVLAVTCVLEVLQLWSHPVLDAIRATFLGRTLIGSTFSWWDFPCYVLGCALAVALVTALARPGGATGRGGKRGYPRRARRGG
jgi:hypothetical protein